MLKKILGIMLVVMLLTGCGTQVRQDGNKIYTDISKDQAYAFTSSALKTKGYKIIEESKTGYYIKAIPEYNRTFLIETAEKRELSATITNENQKETVVTLIAVANGNFDKEESNSIVAEAVKEIITELNLYGIFTASQDGSATFPVATIDRLSSYIKNYLTKNNFVVSQNAGVITGTELTVLNPFDTPLNTEISLAKNLGNRNVTVAVKATLKSNYDIKGNQAYVDIFIEKFLAHLKEYPVVEKEAQFIYKYIDLAKAFDNTKKALRDAGCSNSEVNAPGYTIAVQKNNVTLLLSITRLNDTLAVNALAYAEAAANESKTQLDYRVTNALSSVQGALSKYQTILAASKSFTSGEQKEVANIIQTVLKNLNYRSNYNPNEQNILANKSTAAERSHFFLINKAPTAKHIRVEIYTLYNAKSLDAQAIAKREQTALLAALRGYDGQGSK